MSGLGVGILLLLLAVAAWNDSRAHRIPNLCVLAGIALGFAWSAWAPDGQGLVAAAEGLGVGLLVLLPLYAIGAMKAGDVKLTAMVGSFLGPIDVVGATLATFMVGGAIALIVALKHRALRQMLANVWFLVVGSAVGLATGSMPRPEMNRSAGRMAYGVAVAAGTAAFVAWQRLQG
jgi:prepilin peptidase CpaA